MRRRSSRRRMIFGMSNANDVSAPTGRHGTEVWSDVVFYAAIAMLPVDGTVIGGYMPFWTPISPWLFMLYAALNCRLLPIACRGFRPFLLLPLLLLVLSIVDWVTVAIHPLPALWSFLGLLGALSCVMSLEIAVRVKRLDWRAMIRLLIIVYWIAFVVGVVQFLAIRFDVGPVRDWFSQVMYREYITSDSQWGGDRPQFLFAEPSYIGMHLYGVLLPLMWMMGRRGERVYAKRLRNLIIVFAAGSMVMGVGVRIIVDSIIALVIALIVHTDFHDRRQIRQVLCVFGGMFVASVVALLTNERVRTIIQQGPHGDDSASARIVESMMPFAAGALRPLHMLIGFGAGNVTETERIVRQSGVLLPGMDDLGGYYWWRTHYWHPGSVTGTITMSAYSSFIGEFGLIGIVALAVVVIWHVSRYRAWNRTTVCWLLLVAYLYVQFEGYAFYALPLFIWDTAASRMTVDYGHAQEQETGFRSDGAVRHRTDGGGPARA